MLRQVTRENCAAGVNLTRWILSRPRSNWVESRIMCALFRHANPASMCRWKCRHRVPALPINAVPKWSVAAWSPPTQAFSLPSRGRRSAEREEGSYTSPEGVI